MQYRVSCRFTSLLRYQAYNTLITLWHYLSTLYAVLQASNGQDKSRWHRPEKEGRPGAYMKLPVKARNPSAAG
eukprot:scaffold558600_cov43-Prasinocladus_malaysianus.AAC.1